MGFIALYLSIAFFLIFFRGSSAINRSSSFFSELDEQVNFRDIDKNIFIPPEGKRLENNFCIVDIEPQKSACHIIEKQLPYLDGYHCIKIKNSYKTGDLYGAIFEIFETETNYDTLKMLCNAFEVYYTESYVLAEIKQPKKSEEKSVKENTEDMTMPVLHVEMEEPKIDKETEVNYNKEREVDL